MKYTSIFLDLDNTLLDFGKAEHRAVKLVLKENGMPCGDDTAAVYSAINRDFWERFENGEIPKSAIFAGRFEKLFNVLNLNGDPEKTSKRYSEHLSDCFFTVEGTFELLGSLKSKGYYLYATTNGMSSTQFKRIKGSGLEPYFDKIFVSEDAGAQKPQKEYFDYVISNIREKDRSKMLIVGDSQSSDILGGINAGIDTCWYNPSCAKAKYKSTYEIKSLAELNGLL